MEVEGNEDPSAVKWPGKRGNRKGKELWISLRIS